MDYLSKVGKYMLMLGGSFSKPENFRLYWREFMHQCNEIGIKSLPIVVIISIFLGAVTTVQISYQLVSPLIPVATISLVVRDSIILELSPTVLCIVLAGVVGSKMASELGNMRVSEQIDALEMMGINSKAYLILPKILACLLTIPFLVGLSAMLGIFGGRLAGAFAGIIDVKTFDTGLRSNFRTYTVEVMFVKAYAFAFIISTLSCFFGYFVKGGSLAIGQSSTASVIMSCIGILAADYAISALLLQ